MVWFYQQRELLNTRHCIGREGCIGYILPSHTHLHNNPITRCWAGKIYKLHFLQKVFRNLVLLYTVQDAHSFSFLNIKPNKDTCCARLPGYLIMSTEKKNTFCHPLLAHMSLETYNMISMLHKKTKKTHHKRSIIEYEWRRPFSAKNKLAWNKNDSYPFNKSMLILLFAYACII